MTPENSPLLLNIVPRTTKRSAGKNEKDLIIISIIGSQIAYTYYTIPVTQVRPCGNVSNLEVPSLNFGSVTGYADRGFRDVPRSFHEDPY
jgi:hypothetical protein